MAELEILYQDEAVVAVNKPSGLLVHPGREPLDREWIAMKVLRDQLDRYVYPAHRLDRPTSGVLLFALDQEAEATLKMQFERREVQKVYRTVVLGEVAEVWEDQSPLAKNEGEEPLPCRTAFRRHSDKKLGDSVFSSVEVKPLTGRFHQIRKHLALAGTPVLGDYLYGDVATNDSMVELTGRLMLHACSLAFNHPSTGQRLVVEAPLPPCFANFKS